MKKTIISLITAGSLLTPAAAFAQNTETVSADVSAEIKEQNNETVTIDSAKAADIEKYINDETVIIGKDGKTAEEVKEGDKVFVDTLRNTAVILESDYEGSIDINVYSANGGDETNSSLINSSRTLVLNISDDTVITDLEGNKVDKSELEGKVIAVYYTVTTKSLPPQTTPEKIVVVKDAETASIWEGVVESFENGEIKTADNSFKVNEDTVIIGEDGKITDKVSKGDKLAVDVKNNVVAILNEESVETIKTDTFKKLDNEKNDQYISSDEQLIINISDETAIANLEGEKLTKEDIEGKKIVAYYSIMTASLPPQAPVGKIVVLDKENTEENVQGTYMGTVESYENSVIKTADLSFTVMKDTVILNDKETIEKGDKVFINAEKNVVAVTNGDYIGFVDIDTYNKSGENEFGEYISSEKDLALNIGEETEIIDLRGNKVSKDKLDNTLLAVYHTIATMSIPAQTTPEKIVAIDAELPEPTKCNFTYGDKSFVSAFTKSDDSFYVPVRAVSEGLGLKVYWDGTVVAVTVEDNDKRASFNVNSTVLNDNGAKAYISEQNNSTYVPVEFFSDILTNEFGNEVKVEFE